ncbi:MAG TPA: hypothetical protein VGJ53_05650 [Micromonosporaceae bacterium]|jgi:hypothetical protein
MTGPASAGQRLEIACDESGYEGEKLIGATTDVFAHGSVRMDAESAARCMAELRMRIRSPATEYKATHVLREKHRSVLRWLLRPSGPLQGNAHVYLVDKAFFVLGKLTDLLVDEDERARSTVVLYREGRRAFDRDQWEAFLASSNNLMRGTDRFDVRSPVDSFFGMVDALRLAGAGGRVDAILRSLSGARQRADSFRTRLLNQPTAMPVLDPLIPAIVRAVVFWGEGRRRVFIVHDQQKTLSVRRIAQLEELINEAGVGHSSGARLAGLTLVDSTSDPRVQLADILAGVARKIASDELNERGDARFTALLRPYVDRFSIWGDDRSWALLGR